MTLRQIGQLILMSALWGAVFLLIKYALEDFSAVEVAFFQAAIGAVGLLGIVLVGGGRACAALGDIVRRPLPAILLGALAIAAPFILIATGELSVPSGLAGVLVSSTPMFVAMFAPRFDRSAETNRVQTVGLVVGLVGVALVVGVQSVSSLGQFLGALAILGAAACGALSSFIVKLQYRDKNVPPSTTSLFSLSVGAVLVAPVAVVTASGGVPGARAVVAVIVLGLACTALTFMLYYSLIDQVGEERAALGNYLTPIFALFYGVLLLGEQLTIAAIAGLALIIVGAEITLRGDSAKPTGGKAQATTVSGTPAFPPRSMPWRLAASALLTAKTRHQRGHVEHHTPIVLLLKKPGPNAILNVPANPWPTTNATEW